jgi:hypothetical protein
MAQREHGEKKSPSFEPIQTIAMQHDEALLQPRALYVRRPMEAPLLDM